MTRLLKAAALIGAIVGVHGVTTGAESSRVPTTSGGSGGMESRRLTPEERAIELYNSGIDHRDKGIKHEEKAVSATKPSDRTKAAENARKEFEKAMKDFTNAVSSNPKMFQAYNGLGYAYRKLGDYTKALEHYDKALQMQPAFTEAIEYRAEAYLGLNRLDDVKAAYLSLFAADRARADTLMSAMKRWIADRTATPAGVEPAAVAAFGAWVQERDEMARTTKLMALNAPPRSW
jgi:tetratricopeptide (TPR) repeat protein